MNWLKQKLLNWLSDDMAQEASNYPNVKKRKGSISSLSPTRELSSSGIQFTMYKANGGIVIECREYDSIRDNNDYTLHIITSDQDLGEQLSHILTYQQLKK